MTNKVSEARKAFEQELQRLTGKPCQQVTERLIDLMVAVRDELRKQSNGK
jgi:hypothetical protein